MKYETFEDRIVISNPDTSAYIGGHYESDDKEGSPIMSNKCYGCVYDFVLKQAEYTPSMNRVELGKEPEFWDVQID